MLIDIQENKQIMEDEFSLDALMIKKQFRFDNEYRKEFHKIEDMSQSF